MSELAKVTETTTTILLLAAVLLYETCGHASAAGNLRDWINDKNNLGKFGAVIAEPKAQQNNSQIYYFQITPNTPNATFPMIFTITCTQTKEAGAVCSNGNIAGAPPGFPGSFRAPVFP